MNIAIMVRYATPNEIRMAREWVSECTWREEPEDIEDMTDEQIVRGVNAHYEGGWAQFLRDAE